MSQGKPAGFDLVAQTALEMVSLDLQLVQSAARGDSPIERLMWVALYAVIRYDLGSSQRICIAHDDAELADLMSQDERRSWLVVQSQAQRENWRVDFVVHAFSQSADAWKALIVECDGHEFHERTKEQALRDRSRDRSAQAAGAAIYRFTGAELYRDPWACAQQVASWARGAQK